MHPDTMHIPAPTATREMAMDCETPDLNTKQARLCTKWKKAECGRVDRKEKVDEEDEENGRGMYDTITTMI